MPAAGTGSRRLHTWGTGSGEQGHGRLSGHEKVPIPTLTAAAWPLSGASGGREGASVA